MARVYSENFLVRQDLDDIFGYIAKDNPAAAFKVIDTIISHLEQIQADPERFPSYRPNLFRHDSLYRCVVQPYTNYLIFYELTREEIRVLYVHHGARDFEARHLREERL